jgi:hypothetical protein
VSGRTRVNTLDNTIVKVLPFRKDIQLVRHLLRGP